MGNKIAVLGGGTMGVGIAYVAALAGGNTVVIEPDDTHSAGPGAAPFEDAIGAAQSRAENWMNRRASPWPQESPATPASPTFRKVSISS